MERINDCSLGELFKPQRAQKPQKGTNSLEALVEFDASSSFYLCFLCSLWFKKFSHFDEYLKQAN